MSLLLMLNKFFVSSKGFSSCLYFTIVNKTASSLSWDHEFYNKRRIPTSYEISISPILQILQQAKNFN